MKVSPPNIVICDAQIVTQQCWLDRRVFRGVMWRLKCNLIHKPNINKTCLFMEFVAVLIGLIVLIY